MRPFPQTILVLLLLALCGLCTVQWWRESKLREVVGSQRDDIERIKAERDDLTEKMKAADAEVLRLTAALADLRGNSVSRVTHEEEMQKTAQLRDLSAKQSSTLKEQAEAIARQNSAIQQANGTIKKLTAERDQMAARANEATERYNALVKKP